MMKKKRNKSESLNENDFNTQFGSVNIEPPRIYREDQKVKKENLNKTEITRRQTKKRKLKNSVRKALIAISLIVLLLAVGVTLSLTVFFKIDTIEVTGSGIYSSEQVIDNCSINYGDNLFLIKSDSSKARLTKNLPYVYDVKITRKMPSTIVFEITDAKVLYEIENDDESFILLDDNFKVLENGSAENMAGNIRISDVTVNKAEPGTIVVFENEDISDCLSKISEAIKKTEMAEATSISSIDTNHNYIIYDNRITFELGTCDNLENKIYKGLAACDKLNQSSPKTKGRLNLNDDKQIYFTEE